MTLGELVMINAYMIQLFIPLAPRLHLPEIREALINIERVFGLMEAPVKVQDRPQAPALQVTGGEVRFEGVCFAYQADRPILHEVSFTIPAGHTLAVVGPSGAGKSTLARLLFRFHDVDQGSIRIDGQDIREVTQQSLRAHIGVVPQDTVLFNDTIGFNIAYGRPGASEQEIWEALRMAWKTSSSVAPGSGHPGGRARAQAVRWRTAAYRHRPGAAEESAAADSG